LSTLFKISILNNGKQDSLEVTDESFFIGRSVNSTITIKNDQLSRKHLHVKLHENVIYIMDLNTTNGTFLNNRQITASKWVSLIELDTIGFGHSDIKMQIIHEFVKDENILPLKRSVNEQQHDSKQHSANNAFSSFEGSAAVVVEPDATPRFNSSEFEILEKNRITAEIEKMSVILLNKAKSDAKEILLKAQEKKKQLAVESSDFLLENELKIKELIQEQTSCSNAIKDLLVDKHEYEQKVEDLSVELSEILVQHEVEESRLKALKQELLTQKTNGQSDIDLLENKVVDLNSEYLVLLEKNDDLVFKSTETEDRYKKIEYDFLQLRDREIKSYDKIESLDKRIENLLDKKENVQSKTSLLEDEFLSLKSSKLELTQLLNELDQKILNKESELSGLSEKLDNEFSEKRHKFNDLLDELETAKVFEFDSLIDDAKVEANLILSTARRTSEDIIEQAHLNITNNEKISSDHIDEQERKVSTLLLEAEHKLESSKQFELERLNQLDRTESEFEEQLAIKTKDLENQLNEQKLIHEDKIKDSVLLSKDECRSIIEKANADARVVLDSARVESNSLLESSQEKVVQMQRESTSLLHKEKKDVEETILSLRSDIEEYVTSKDLLASELSQLKNDLESEKTKLLDEISGEKHQTLEVARTEAISIEKDAKEEALSIIDKAHSDAELTVAEAINEASRIKVKEEEVLAKLKDSERELLAKLRAKEVEAIKEMRTKAHSEITIKKSENINSLVLGIENIINEHVMYNSSEAGVDTKLIGQLVKQSLLGEKSHDNAALKKLNPYGPGGGKSSLFMKRIIIVFVTLVLVLGTHLIFPQIYNSFSSLVKDTVKVERSAQDMYKEGIQDKRANAPKYSPAMTSEFKDSYVDNTLYTSSFSDTWLSDDFQKQWTIKIDEVLVYKFQLSDYVVIKYISLEFKLVRDLKELRGKITLKNQNEIIAQMVKLEKNNIKKIESLVGGEENLEKLLLIQQGFYTDYLN
jgi:pSer/pThr/pTyr-binding forkhead associated (FHA) protein